MFFVKKFKFTMESGLELVNKKELNSYIEEKIQHFSKYENYSSKEEKLKLLDEIVQMCDYDKSNAIFDYTSLPSFEGFNIADKEPDMIYYFNLDIILGGIFLNVFDKENNRIARVEDGISGAISTRSMFLRAYEELIRCKNDNLKPAYGATLIFATLIEKDIKDRTKIIYAQRYLTDLKAEIDAGRVTLTSEENKLYDFLQFQYGIIQSRTTTANFNPIIACTQMQYDLLLKYNIVQANDRDIANLLCNKITLNQLLQSQAFKNIADDRFVSFATLLFGTGNVNLRNDLAHCNTTYSNYYSIHITALLCALFTMVSDESFLK